MSTETTPSICGHSFTHDHFGNRTNQTLAKGSGPTHSIAIDATTNWINSARDCYYANGNLTQMPLMSMTYDVAKRMLSSRHSRAGNEICGCNHANQRAQKPGPDSVRNGNTVTYYLYGMGGERLMEFQETCTNYTENQRWIYFAGGKMFSKTGSTLKAISPNRLDSEAKHYPYGETQGTQPADTKDCFATYRRDGTGLDYAWNRCTYVGNNPIANFDPMGLFQRRPPSDGPEIPTHICTYDPWFCNEDYKPDVGIDTRLIVQTRRDEPHSQRRAFEKYMEE